MAGCALGVLLGSGLASIKSSLLVGLARFDPVAFAASMMPPLQAISIQPTEALREE